jgi:kumamolisin
MRAAYYGGTALTGAGQYLGLFQFAGYDIADVNTYFKNVGQTLNVPIVGISTDGTSVNCVYPSCDDTEQTLDITQATSMAPGLATLYVFVGSSDTAIFAAMSTHSPLTAQMSASWMWTPADPSADDPYFEKFAAQGQNFFAAAGDWNSWKTSPYAYPAEDAYVTGVGGTDLQTQSAGGPWASETAWSDSGGGISPDGIPIPSWQQLSGVINSKNQGSTTLRNGPDVAAESNFDFYVCADQRGCGSGWGGTSFAAPMWAGFMALVNQQAVANGNPTLGFINPIIYPIGVGSGYGNAFHDITSGNNGYPAVAGYDLVTGWGSPNGSGLINALAGSGSGGPVVTLSPTSLKWGKKVVGVTSAAKKVILTNSGNATLNITTIAASGDFALATVKKTKKITPCVNGGTVAAGATCEIKVTFTPTQKGARTGDVTFTDNAANSPQQVALTGTGK